MIKKIGVLILTACLLISFASFGVQAAGGNIGNNINWTLKDGVLRITGNGELPNYTISSFAPWYKHASSVNSLVVGNGITRIGDYSFLRMTELESVNLPESLLSIGNSAFSGCTKLSGLIFPDNLNTLGDSVFYGCSSIELISINKALSKIGNSAFGGMTSIKAFVVSSSNSKYSSVENVLYADNEKTLVAFPNGKSDEYVIPDGVIKIGAGAFRGSFIKKVSIPSTVEVIDIGAFAECLMLKELRLSDGLKTIGENAFMLTGLEKVVIPSSVTSIGNRAFKYSQSLNNASFSGNAPACGSEAFYGCDPVFAIHIKQNSQGFTGTAWNVYHVVVDGIYEGKCGETVQYKLDTSDGVLRIYGKGDISDYKSANDVPWNNCKYGITSIIIEDGITRVGNYAFSGCTVKSVSISDSVEAIGVRAFSNVSVINSLKLSENLKKIEDGAFENSSLCFRISVPETVNYIGSGAFSNVENLTSLFFRGNAPLLGSGVFNGLKDTVVNYMPGKTGFDKTPWTSIGASPKYAGDCDNDGYVDTGDVIVLMKYNAGWNVNLSAVNADVNADGKVNTDDVLLLMKYLAGWNVILY